MTASDFPDLSFPARININFKLSPDLESLVVAMNRVFVTHGFNEIDFSEDSDHLPHVTLLMGKVESLVALQRITQTCQSIAVTLSPLAYMVSRPYWKMPSKKFLFLDTEPLDEFRQFRLALYAELEHDISCEPHGGPENPSHISVGYGDPRKVPLKLLETMYSRISATGNEMRICQAGEHGTCHSVIANFHLD